MENIIKIKHGTGNDDEAYGEWYDCPECDYTMITDECNFCGGCGKKIEWEEADPPEYTLEKTPHTDIIKKNGIFVCEAKPAVSRRNLK